MTIKTRLRTNIYISIGLAAVVAAILLFADRGIDHEMEKNFLADRISKGVYELFTVSRSYLAYGEERPRIQWELQLASLQRLIGEARRDTRGKNENLETIAESLNEIGVLFGRIVSYYPGLEGSSEAQKALVQGILDRLESQVIAKGQETGNSAFLLIQESNRALSAVKRNLIALIIATIVAAIGVSAAASLLLSRRILTDLDRLQEGTQVIAAGNLRHRLETRRGDEMGRLAAAFNEMTRRLEDSEREREATIRKLAASNRELEDFAFVASHDLQEPLRKIQTFGERLKEKWGDGLGEGGRDYLARMQNAAVRMQTLIQDLLSYSRLSTRPEPFSPVALAPLVREVVSDLAARIEQTGGRVEVGELPVVESSPHQMRQLFQNLLGNSLKFHGEAPPIIRVSARKGATPDGERVELRVADNGIGFDEKYLDRIFLPFQRLQSRSRYEGTGMGLAICRKIAERHGGTITAKSAPGAGVTFLVTLPVRQASKEKPLPEKGAQPDVEQR